MNNAVSAILAIAARDFMKLLRDRPRLISSFIFPLVFIGILGGSLQSNLGDAAGFNFLTFTYIGVIAQTLFQSSALGIISLIEDRENDFSQEIFVSPISRYAIVFGKILGESLVALTQIAGVVAFGYLIRVPMSLSQLLGLIPIMVIICFLGGAFGVLLLSRMSNQRTANQVFPFIMLPQFFIAGVFAPIRNLPWFLDILAKIAPMRYAVDLARGVYYAGSAEYSAVVLKPTQYNLAIIVAMFSVFLIAGTWLFVQGERNR